jgi:ATP phosphoribosyltransferase regulatory subunit
MDCRVKPGNDDIWRGRWQRRLMPSVTPRLRALFDRAGARFVDVPVLHLADPFLETAGEEIRRRMFVTEGPQGERLALRPDFTVPVCLAHLQRGDGPARYAYRGLVFRRHDEGSPERLEAGYEDIGGTDPLKADAEALALAIACATEAAPGGITIRLGDIALFDALLRALGLPGRWRRRLRHSFGLPKVMAASLERMVEPRDAGDRRLDEDVRAVANDHDGLVALLAARHTAHRQQKGAGRAPEEIVERFLSQRAIPDVGVAARAAKIVGEYVQLRAELPRAADALWAFSIKHGIDLSDAVGLFAKRAKAIAAQAGSAAIVFEAGFGRPLDYYTGLVFELRVEGLRDPLIGGGRYDRMMEMLGAPSPVPAVGFTMRLDQVEAGE